MKTIYLARHAKSSWKYSNIKDIDRPLKKLGINSAILIGERLFNARWIPELIISSPANRAIHTALIFSRALNLKYQIELDEKLYFSGLEGYNDCFKNMSPAVSSVMMVGHNPTTTDFCNIMLGTNGIANVPTSGVVKIDLNLNEWRVPQSTDVQEVQIMIPKDPNAITLK